MQPLDPSVRNSWGPIADAAWLVTEQGAAGNTPIALSGPTQTLSTANNAPDQGRLAMWNFIGALGSNCSVTVPPVARIGWARNSTTGAHNVVLTTGAGRTVTLTPGMCQFYTSDGTNIDVLTPAFSGPVTATSGTFSGPLTATTGTFSGPLTATTGTFSGIVRAAGLISTSGGASIAGQITVTGGAVVIDNNQSFGAKDTGGTARGILRVNSSNNTQLLNANPGGSIQITNSQGTPKLTMDDGGTWNFIGPVFGAGSASFAVSGWIYNTTGGGPFSSGGSNFSFFASGGTSMGGGAFVATSDARLKSGIEEISEDDALRWVMTARPVTYLKRGTYEAPEESGIPEAGFLAQDQVRAGYARYVQAVKCEGMPERVDSDGFVSCADAMLMMPADNWIAYLTRALQVALARIEALEARLR